MLIAIPAETDPGECRVAATPETVKKFAGFAAEVRVESGAGLKSGLRDEDYSQAGAIIVADAAAAVSGADIVLRFPRSAAAEIAVAKPGAAVLAIMDPYGNAEALKSVAAAGVCAFAMEFMP